MRLKGISNQGMKRLARAVKGQGDSADLLWSKIAPLVNPELFGKLSDVVSELGPAGSVSELQSILSRTMERLGIDPSEVSWEQLAERIYGAHEFMESAEAGELDEDLDPVDKLYDEMLNVSIEAIRNIPKDELEVIFPDLKELVNTIADRLEEKFILKTELEYDYLPDLDDPVEMAYERILKAIESVVERVPEGEFKEMFPELAEDLTESLANNIEESLILG